MSSDFNAGKTWLLQMGAGAELDGITVQYCMSLPREILQSSEVESVRRARVRYDKRKYLNNMHPGVKLI